VIDGATNSVLATVQVGSGSCALCYNSQSNKVYCANSADSTVTVIDGATDSVLATVEVGNQPYALCHNLQNNKVYCANQNSDNVTVIDGASNQVLRSVGVGGSPRDFAWNPVQNRMYVANSGGSSISVLRDSGGGIEENFKPQAAGSRSAATVIRGVLVLPGLGTRSELPGRNSVMSRAALLDISGRKVLDLRPGANNVRALAPGVYFVRAVSREPSAVSCRKVVIAR
jgi:YVTN family beta-propeller protein